MSVSTPRNRGLIVGAVIAGIGLLIAMIAITSSSASPRGYIGANYRCNFDPTEIDSVICQSNLRPSNVAAAIARDVSPIDRRTADNGTVFLQYSDDIVAIKSTATGSEIEVDDYDRGYRKHLTYIGVFGWSSSRPGGSGFGGFGK
ncbi:uncharacterized protein DUF4247 [Stackebrandtia endophytica]|uniref:Uncharacterized protein DUF4247 n=1 Tax=Stackebrandtia endophytica TaxID=1496996 RepID=A0A543AV45_9ACTN|nr:DUF4247 domain-containing protein [Stackebrandtia endophytica]TQL76455.1 uncharacterized protein DUF4247 [Stackebrandtia endophytica]